MQVPVYERQVGISPMPGARVSAPGDANAWGAGVGTAVHALGERAYQMAQDAEDAKTLSLFNAFRRESQQYHEDPGKGIYQTRKLGGAAGVYQDADDWIVGKIGEYDRKMPSSRAARNFRRMAEQYREQRGDQNSRFEAEQMRQYREGEADAAIKLGLDDIAANYEDEAAVEKIKQGMDAAVELRTRGMSESARRAFWAEIDNRAATTRLARMLEADPQKAAAWFGEHKDQFTADGLVRGEGAVNNALKQLRAEQEREARQLEAEQERQGVYRAADAYWDRFGGADAAAREAIYGDTALTDEQKDRVWARIEARAADEDRWQRQREVEWKNGWLDKIAESGSMEEALSFIEQSGASGQDRLSMERMAAQVHRPEKFNEDIRDWAQAFDEVKKGKLKNADELIYRWGGRLSSGTIKIFTRMFYQNGGDSASRDKGPSYVGYSYSDNIHTVMKNIGISDFGSEKARQFVTYAGEAVDAEEKKLKRKMTPLELGQLLDNLAKQHVLNDGSRVYEFEYRQAQKMGFNDVPGWGFFRERTDEKGETVYEYFDPNGKYEQPEEPEKLETPLPPLPERKAPVREGGQKRSQGQRPRMMPNGTPFPERRKKTAPAPGGAGKKTAGRTSYEELRGTIESIAAENGVDPALIRAMITVESAWNTKAVSDKYAKGLMQLMPATAKRFGVTDVFDAEQSIRGGTKYMAFLLKRYNGDIEKAVGAYNTGEGNMDKWIAGKKKLHPQTVKYVPKVMALYRRYQGETKKS